MITIEQINGAVTLVSTAFPQLIAAYTVLKAIWMRMHPTATEQDFLDYLQAASQKNVDETAIYLTAQGYVKQEDGSWKKAAA